eukprot:s8053_g2.t1
MLNEAGPVFVYDGHAVQVKMAVITRGMVGACAYVLEQEGLLHFVEVFGSLKAAHGELEFDRLVLEPSPLEGTGRQHCQSKASLIQVRRSDGIGVAFVSQTPAEVDSVASLCHGVLVSEGPEAFWVELRQLCGLTKSKAKLPEDGPMPFAPAATRPAGEPMLGTQTTLAKRCVHLLGESQAPTSPVSPVPSSPTPLPPSPAPSPRRVLRAGPEWGNSWATGFDFQPGSHFGAVAFTPAPRQGEDQEHLDSGPATAERRSSRRHSEVSRPPKVDVLAQARKTAQTLALELEEHCLNAAAAGKRHVDWGTGDLYGLGRDAGDALLREFAARVEQMGFVTVEWWRGQSLGWRMEPGPALPSDGPWPRTCETKPVPVERRRFGAWAYALRLRVGWDAPGRQRRPGGVRTTGPSQRTGNPAASELRRASEFSVSPRVRPPSRCPVCRDGSHRRARLQPCGHLFCRPCGKRLLGRACLRCGVTCRQVEDCQFQAPTCGVADAPNPDAETLVWGATGGAYCLRPSVRSPMRREAKTKVEMPG